ncbi:MAG TPA: peptidoglycan-associated lipoprotein, partial [Candidatus Aminicenantes bacterium]|nr:peptidoglycan-associated lipoprotein [Candidatus Aminicenantes bacterium]
MKKLLVLSLVLAVSLFAFSCKKKVKTTPEPQPAVEKVEKVEEPAPKINPEPLSEEELFQKKTIEELNKEGVLKNVLFDFDKYNVREDQVPVVDGT